jgi:hypothetical protein
MVEWVNRSRCQPSYSGFPAPRSAVTRKITWPNPGSRCAVSRNAIYLGRGPRPTSRNIDRQPSLEVTSARQINQPRRPHAADPVKERSRSWNRLTVRSSCVSEPVGNALICRIEDVHLLPSFRPNRGRPSAIHSARYASNETGGGAVLGLSSFPNS